MSAAGRMLDSYPKLCADICDTNGWVPSRHAEYDSNLLT